MSDDRAPLPGRPRDGLEDAGDCAIPGLASLRAVTPPTSLVAAVMRRVAEPRPFSLWRWLRQPRRLELRLSPLGAAALIAATAGAALALARIPAQPRSAAPPTTMAPPPEAGGGGPPSTAPAAEGRLGGEAPKEVVLVRFVLNAKSARKVAVAGDFNGWDAEGTPLEDADGRGTFVATVPLPRGAHQYMFVVDGAWIPDPAAEQRPDGFGRTNAVLRL